MSKFCGHCGTTLADNATFCPNCGAPVTDQAPQQQFAQPQFNQAGFQPAGPVGSMPKAGMSKKAKLAIIIGVSVVAAGLLIWLIISLLGGGYEKPIKNYIKSLENQDVDLFVDSVTPGGDIGSLLGGLSESSAKSQYTSRLKNMVSKYGEDFKITYEILEKQEVTKAETLGIYDGGYKLKIKFLIKGSKKEATVTKNVSVIKSGGKWSLSSAISF